MRPNPPAEAKSFYETIIEKNNLCILTGDSSDIVNLEERTRMIWAMPRSPKSFQKAIRSKPS